MFDRLYKAEKPGKETGDHLDDLNEDSLEIRTGCKLERSFTQTTPDEPNWTDGIRRFQFERTGYFCIDKESSDDKMIFNRTATLRDSWAKRK